MNSETKKYFTGKICTIFTTPINRDYKFENPDTYPSPLYEYFLGKIIEFQDLGLLLENIKGTTRSFFFYNQIISICEEEIIDPKDPKNEEIIKSFKESKEKEKQIINNKKPYLDTNKYDKYND